MRLRLLFFEQFLRLVFGLNENADWFGWCEEPAG
jgi:hypothetical protein